jgi:hypothetical protein
MGFLDRFRRTPPPGNAAAPPPPAPVPAPDADGSVEDELREAVRLLVAPGFRTRAQVEESVIEMVLDDPDGWPGTSEDAARAVVAAVWDEVAARRTPESGQGDFERLAAAFAELEAEGVTARMDFACCQNCGHAEIGDERAEGQWGYTFFHEQDTERLADADAELYLAFGVYGGAADDQPVGERVVAALRGQGLPVEWDGTPEQRIRVAPLDWRKELPV